MVESAVLEYFFILNKITSSINKVIIYRWTTILKIQNKIYYDLWIITNVRACFQHFIILIMTQSLSSALKQTHNIYILFCLNIQFE